MSGGEILMVVLLFLLLFGAKSIPDIARTLAKGMREFRKASDDIKREISESTSGLTKDIDEITSNIQKQTNDVKKNITDNLSD